ncbi:MAG: class I mannose-6-phosphate isomerase [Bacteroidales bacterium]|nr:class I mannose-6-phosphate isomerase [Bacteroidales bacterium]
MYPLVFKPILKQKIWGGERIIPFKHLDGNLAEKDENGNPLCLMKQVGESWEISGYPGSESVVAEGELSGISLPDLIDIYKGDLIGRKNYEKYGNRFPLLIKFIDAADDLSLQVHPDDELAGKRNMPCGKTEMWYILDATPEASLLSGFSKKITREEYKKMVKENTILDVINRYPVAHGDVYFLPAGRIHGIGSGTFLTEIQQTSDATYRIYDYDRKDKNGKSRELHVEQSLDAVNFDSEGDCGTVSKNMDKTGLPVNELVKCDYFTTSLIIPGNSTENAKVLNLDISKNDSFSILIVGRGSGILTAGDYSEGIRAGDVLLVPASFGSLRLECLENSGLEVLETHI